MLKKKHIDHILTQNSNFEELANRQDGDQRDGSAEKSTCYQAWGPESKPLDPHGRTESPSEDVL